MAQRDSDGRAPGQSTGRGSTSPDVLVIGAGIMGLWAAVKAARRGASVRLVEGRRVGAGASGGLLGALMPHGPDRWNEKKQVQFEALMALPGEIAALEAANGLSAGYRRCGRLVPLSKPHLREIALRQSAEATIHWRQAALGPHWRVEGRSAISGWPEDGAMACGLVHETLSARVDPRRLLALLAAELRRFPGARLDEGVGVRGIDAEEGSVQFEDGSRLEAGAVIVACGVASFPLIDRMRPVGASPTGSAVKGQAALLDARIDPSWPIVYADGLYIVPHETGHVAIGSTSEPDAPDPLGTDGRLDALIGQAVALAPMLKDAPVIERWAGLRPRAIGREPMLGRHPDHPRLFFMTGGYKVSFGLAHRLADSVVAEIAGDPTLALPAEFAVGAHLALADMR
ncbi:NAD(P)/FAD-dependent oxidoreductase [Ensifer soli]|uniref:NAD(P)/FAD-dependent oxidoreductase n=1 Tax=Ciceribacter sp. sgz301302 TaxID=3342379 RepID=UPI0035B8BB0D